MIPVMKILFLLTMLSKVLLVASQEHCISEYFLEKVNSVFTCDFQSIKKYVNESESSDEFNCIHFLGLPNMSVCGAVGLRFKRSSNAGNSSISLRYFSDTNREAEYEIIEMSGKYGWNHWSKNICANFQNGRKSSKNYCVNLYVESSATVQFDRILFFINAQKESLNVEPKQTPRHNTCDDNKERHSSICDPEVQYFGWKVTAIILIIVTVGSLILVISLSVTMPYNVWDKPKIQRLPVRLTDEVITPNY